MPVPDSNDPIWSGISKRLGGELTEIASRSRSASGPTCRITCGGTRYFVKFCPNRDILAAEWNGLAELFNAGAIRVPRPILYATFEFTSALVSEYIELTGRQSNYPRFAADLSALHSHTGPCYGWQCDNYIGRTPQINSQCGSWREFFLEFRLNIQLVMARRNGYSGALRSLGGKVLNAADRILSYHQPRPSLLHGDLWSGNFGFDGSGTPVIFDPAVYYGDAETDLAMTRLFGAPPDSFYASYHRLNPPPDGWQLRADLYNLYHILNHLNIFGSAYLGQAERLMKSILREAG